MKLKKIVALGLSLFLFTANIAPLKTVFADNKKEFKKEKVKKESKENELDLVMAGDVLLHLRLAYWSANGKGGYDRRS